MVNVAGDVPVDGSKRGLAAARGRLRPSRELPQSVSSASLMAANAPDLDEDRARGTTEDAAPGNCCPLYHEAVELVGRAGRERSSAC